MDGFLVMPMEKAAPMGDIFVTVTGNTKVIRQEHFEVIKDGAIVSNSGHFDVEVDVRYLESVAVEKNEKRPMVKEYIINTKNGKKRIYVLAEGRLVNLAAAEGHPASVMDMSFANQSLSAEYILNNYQKLEKDVYKVPDEIDQKVAKLKLGSMGVEIDTLTQEQITYLSSWEHGT